MKKKNTKKEVAIIISVFIFIIGLYYMSSVTAEAELNMIKEYSYHEFTEMVDAGEIVELTYNQEDDYMTFILKNGEEGKSICPLDAGFRREMLEAGIKIKNKTFENRIAAKTNALFSVLGELIIFGMFFVFIMRYQSRMMNGNMDETIVQESDTKFADIIGQDEVLEDIKFVTELMKDSDKRKVAGVSIPKGILLSGPPGTGKTMIAKAVAGEAGVPFLYMNASNFVELYVGMGARRVRQLFKTAKQNSPCIIFIDEIDAVGGSRRGAGRNSEDNRTVNALLQEMDGFNAREGIFVIAATNDSKSLDEALVRAGRFDREIIVNPPKDWQTRRSLFKNYLEGSVLSDDLDLDILAKQTAGFTGADIRAVCNEAAIISAMNKNGKIDNKCLEEAIDKKIFKGNHLKREQAEKDRKVVAYHEAGHAVMTHLVGRPVARASIVGTTSGVGGAVFQEEKTEQLMTNIELEQQVMICYAGRASEEIKFGDVSTGASDDISKATGIIMKYIENYGFNKDIGLIDVGMVREISPVENDNVISLMSDMSKRLYKKTIEELKNNYDNVEKVAEKLLEKNSLNGNEIEELIN